MVLTFTENEDWPAADDLQSLDTQHTSREHFDTAVDMLDWEGSVVLCGPPKSGKSSLGYALLKHYQHKGFAAYYLRSLCCHLLQSLSKGGRSFVLIDGGLGVVRLDIDQRNHCESLLFNTRTLRNNRHCLVVFTAYPHVLRELDFLEDSSRPLLPSTIRIDVTSRSEDPSPVFTPSADSYLPLLRCMLRDPNTGRAMEALLAMSMLGIGHLELNPPEVEPTLQRLELTNVPSFDVRRLACYLKDSILSDTGSGFPSRLLYDAAGLALGRFCSLAVLLQVCDATFLVQRVRTSGTSTESSILISPAEEERLLLMQRMYELIVDGHLPELCQHPSLGSPAFLDDFRVFCTRRKSYVQRLVNAVDTKHGLPLLYWSAWSPSEHLTRWMVEHVTRAKVLSQSLLTAALALVLFTPADAEARSEAKGFLNSLIRLKLKPAAKETLKLTLPLPRNATEKMRGRLTELKTRLQSRRVRYLNNPSLPIPSTLLSVTVTEDAVSVELPSQHWYLALRLLADTEVDETDDDGNTLLHLAADAGHPQVIAVAVKSGASVTVTNRKGLTPCQLAQRRRKGKEYVSAGLHQACSEGDVERLKVLLCQGASLLDKGSKSDTPLHLACRAGKTEVASFLIQLGADIHVKDRYNRYAPLHCACRSGHVDTVRLLVELGADVNVKGNNRYAPLHCACRSGHVDTIRLLVELGADVNVKGKYGDTPLHYACRSGHVDTVRLLVELGADVNVKGKYGDTPLHYACRNGHVDTIRLLVELGADVNVKEKKGLTPFHYACDSGNVDTIRLLAELGANVKVKKTNGRTPLHVACESGDVVTARLLVEHGADVNVKEKNGLTPFHYACDSGNVDTIRLLAELGANVKVKKTNGRTPLHVACESGDVVTARLLVEQGADVNVKERNSGTPLHCACRSGHEDIVRLLVEHGADVNVKGKYGDTPLHYACSNGHVDNVRLLVEHGADVNVKGKYANTPLHYACRNGHVDTVRLLVEHRANVNVRNLCRCTLLSDACAARLVNEVKVLGHHVADVDLNQNYGYTPLCFARLFSHENIARLLVEHGADVNLEAQYHSLFDECLIVSDMSCTVHWVVPQCDEVGNSGDHTATAAQRWC